MRCVGRWRWGVVENNGDVDTIHIKIKMNTYTDRRIKRDRQINR